MTKKEAISIVGDMAEKASNLLAAGKLPVPDSIHVVGMRAGLEEVEAELKRAYIVLSGENPWL
jgi:hypothetical protein